MKTSTLMIPVVALLALSVLASGEESTKASAAGTSNCAGVLNTVLKRSTFSGSALPSAFLKIMPDNFNGTLLIPTNEAYQTAITAILKAASSKTKKSITSLPQGMTNVSLLETPAMQDLLKFHMLYTYGKANPGPDVTMAAIPTRLSSTDKNLCPSGPATTTVDIIIGEKFTFTFKSSVNSVAGVPGAGEYSQDANCVNAGAFLVDGVLLPCDLEGTALVKVVADAAAKNRAAKPMVSGLVLGAIALLLAVLLA